MLWLHGFGVRGCLGRTDLPSVSVRAGGRVPRVRLLLGRRRPAARRVLGLARVAALPALAVLHACLRVARLASLAWKPLAFSNVVQVSLVATILPSSRRQRRPVEVILRGLAHVCGARGDRRDHEERDKPISHDSLRPYHPFPTASHRRSERRANRTVRERSRQAFSSTKSA